MGRKAILASGEKLRFRLVCTLQNKPSTYCFHSQRRRGCVVILNSKANLPPPCLPYAADSIRSIVLNLPSGNRRPCLGAFLRRVRS
jgi:hypothetical protein